MKNWNVGWKAARRLLGKDGRLSVVMPAYRLHSVIGANIDRVYKTLNGNIPFEIVVVDDGSQDGTDAVVNAAADKYPGVVRAVVLPVNGGKGNALKRGFYASRGSHILLLDADLDLLPECIANFFKVMAEEKADIVIGSKRHPESDIDYPFIRRLASRVYYGIVWLLVGLPASDTQTGMKLFKREALQWSFDRMLVKRFAFDLEMLSVAYGRGYKVSEAPIKMEFGNKMGALNFAAVKSVMTDTFAIFYRLRLIKYYQNVELSELSNPPPAVSVVIACPGISSYLYEALEGLAIQTFQPLEIIILPDEPIELRECDRPAGGRASVALADLPLRIIPTGRVRPAEKRNLGINEAKGDIIAFLDDDASPQPQWLAQACRHFSRDKVGATGGPAITPGNDPLMAALGGDVYASPLVSGNCRYRYMSERIRKVDDLPSCNLLARRSLLRSIGGFNTRYWPGEDTILCLDIVNSGKEIVYDPFAIVTHHRRPLFGPHLRQIGRYAKHRGFFARRFPRTSLRFSYMVPSLFVLGIVFGAVAAWFVPLLRYIYFGVLAFYGLVTLIASFHVNPLHWLAVWLGIVMTHIVYGTRFIIGLLFGRMPKDVAAFDHGGEKQ